MRELSCQELPITYQDIRTLEAMQFLHSDPFDRVIMAQAANHKIGLVTVDRDIIQTAERYKEFRVLVA
jgi:PIN domain nuclease of toxin-antitoxin system